MATLTLDIGGTTCGIAVTDDGGVRNLHTWQTGEPTHTLDATVAYLAERQAAGAVIDRVGVCFGGPVDHRTGTVQRSVHADGWAGFNFAQWGNAVLGLPLAVDNDAKVGALAELHHGGHADSNHLIYLTISTGIGAGVVSSGQLVRGADNLAGELGHVRVADDPRVCKCGRTGCLERLCSGYWLEQDHGQPASQLLADDAFLADYSRLLARGLATAVLLYNPKVIVLGGGVARTGLRLATVTRTAIATELASWSHLTPTITPSRFDAEGVHLGAMELARDLHR